MEQNAKNKRYKCDDIPVIFFNFDNEAWEPFNQELEQAHLAARYKNQLNEIERIKAANSTALYASRTKKSERRDERANKRMSKALGRLTLLALAFFAVWLWIKTR